MGLPIQLYLTFCFYSFIAPRLENSSFTTFKDTPCPEYMMSHPVLSPQLLTASPYHIPKPWHRQSISPADVYSDVNYHMPLSVLPYPSYVTFNSLSLNQWNYSPMMSLMKTSDAMEAKHSPSSPVSSIGIKRGNTT